MKIYTRTGDEGTSSLYTGERRRKDDDVFEALGTVDELSSTLGLAREFCEEVNNGLTDKLEWASTSQIQCLLQDVGSHIATPASSASDRKIAKTSFDPSGEHTLQLEAWIDELSAELPALTQFILPSGGRAASTLHMARTICRRAERRYTPLVLDIIRDEPAARFLNRLSDFLFTAARWAAAKEGKVEKVYKAHDK